MARHGRNENSHTIEALRATRGLGLNYQSVPHPNPLPEGEGTAVDLNRGFERHWIQ